MSKKLAGSSPENLLSSPWKTISPLADDGIPPENWLFWISSRCRFAGSFVSQLLNGSGSVPVSWLSKTIKQVNAFPSQRCSGSSPVNILSSTSKFHSLEYFPISGGRTPSSLLLKSLMSYKFGRRPTLAGISPERLLRYKKRRVRFCSSPKGSGIDPVRLFMERSISTNPLESTVLLISPVRLFAYK
ncbi:hypothetical protein IEQ34_003612 [Dendrobium chrysotoxum]|uniref:Uncharacterized protein n=1 Tax=Dendrobium chrysotoxum TaxID=161865 RepID=A0AAV7HK38_DENCH|nr:hypothetical protein IEQ34_003612 [Dendrobium chrysotoxum]